MVAKDDLQSIKRQKQLTDNVPCAPTDALFLLTRWQHFSAWNDVMAAILKVWRQIENLTPSIDPHVLKE